MPPLLKVNLYEAIKDEYSWLRLWKQEGTILLGWMFKCFYSFLPHFNMTAYISLPILQEERKSEKGANQQKVSLAKLQKSLWSFTTMNIIK